MQESSSRRKNPRDCGEPQVAARSLSSATARLGLIACFKLSVLLLYWDEKDSPLAEWQSAQPSTTTSLQFNIALTNLIEVASSTPETRRNQLRNGIHAMDYMQLNL